jgi:hypothetical protein
VERVLVLVEMMRMILSIHDVQAKQTQELGACDSIVAQAVDIDRKGKGYHFIDQAHPQLQPSV